MRVFILAIFLVILPGCAEPALQISRITEDPAQVKDRVIKVVEAQRKKKEWMKVDGCPADSIPTNGRRPTLMASACEHDPAACLTKCDAKDGDSCYALARLIQDNDVIENDVADILYRHACRLGIASGCTNTASLLFEGDDPSGLICAARTFEIACAQEDAWACAMNGLALAEGIGHKKDVDAATRSLDRACEVASEKTGEACTRAKQTKAVIEKQGKIN
ncbi:MAG: hypothetical protein ABI857_06650 [Acidobacteriota bacterium]